MSDLAEIQPAPESKFPTYREAHLKWEKEYAQGVLSAAGGNKSLAARMAGKDRRTFYDLLRRAGLFGAEG